MVCIQSFRKRNPKKSDERQILIYPIIILSIVKIPACSCDVNRRVKFYAVIG